MNSFPKDHRCSTQNKKKRTNSRFDLNYETTRNEILNDLEASMKLAIQSRFALRNALLALRIERTQEALNFYQQQKRQSIQYRAEAIEKMYEWRRFTGVQIYES